MPCSSEHMKPTHKEREHSKVLSLLDELRTGVLPDTFDSGYHKKAYGNYTSDEQLNSKTAKLCSKLQDEDVSKRSLEMQLWWRNHQIVDKERLKFALEQSKDKEARKAALAKLTPYELKLLGL